jgi:hypothetical protein
MEPFVVFLSFLNLMPMRAFMAARLGPLVSLVSLVSLVQQKRRPTPGDYKGLCWRMQDMVQWASTREERHISTCRGLFTLHL